MEMRHERLALSVVEHWSSTSSCRVSNTVRVEILFL